MSAARPPVVRSAKREGGARRTYYRPDWPVGSNVKLQAAEAARGRGEVLVATSAAQRSDPRAIRGPGPDVKLLPAEAISDSAPERLFRLLVRLARNGDALPPRRDIGLAIDRAPAYVTVLLGILERRDRLRFAAARNSYAYAVRLLPDGPVLRTADGAAELDP
jgi:hypothetical protein